MKTNHVPTTNAVKWIVVDLVLLGEELHVFMIHGHRVGMAHVSAVGSTTL